MWVSSLQLTNVRGFQNSGSIPFSKGINILVGRNNSGKSTILKALYLLQNSSSLTREDITIKDNASESLVNICFQEPEHQYIKSANNPNQIIDFNLYKKQISFNIKNNNLGLIELQSNHTLPTLSFFVIPPIEPNNFIYPYLSNRKTYQYSRNVSESDTIQVSGNFSNLYAKIDRISNPEFQPHYNEYTKACDDILGFRITTINSSGGKIAAYIAKNRNNIPLTSMGEGVVNLVGLIVDLCLAENKLFIIEEPENDVHPQALKKLLSFIKEKSVNNQFIISTHSNIVTKYLGAAQGATVFSVAMNLDNRMPVSTIKEVRTQSERHQVLEELGYEFSDYDLWKGWLFLEESSSEEIIREYLIPWFAPKLKGVLRTFSARSVNEVENKFKDFHNFFTFLLLEPIYKNKAWVVIDAGEKEKKVLDAIKMVYCNDKNNWEESRFKQLNNHDFEEYYPKHFKSEVQKILDLSHDAKREPKNKLFEDVKVWIKDNPELAKQEFSKSAQEIILILQEIEKEITPTSLL